MGKSQQLYEKAKTIIPGGTQLLSKRPEMFLPDLWPAYYQRAYGCKVVDLDGNEYTDMSYMGIGSCVLGYADPDVAQHVTQAIEDGSMATLNCPEEVALAEVLCTIHPWAEMARFARTGGEAMAMASRIVRAATGKEIILFCGYHGWHDWYLSANLNSDEALNGHLLPGLDPLGVPRSMTGTIFPFFYNDLDGFTKLMAQHSGKIAGVIMEPVRNEWPAPGFLEKIRETTKKEGIPLVYDEITSGWRLLPGGAHLKLNVNPDLAVFAKGMSNGYPMAAVIGRKRIMNHAQGTFISSTYWTERIGPVAALATINKFRSKSVHDHLQRIGGLIKKGWKETAGDAGLNVTVSGIDPLGHFSFESPMKLKLKTLFTQLMLDRGFLATTAFYASFAHSEEDVEAYLEAVGDVFGILSSLGDETKIDQALKGGVCHSGFSRLT